MASGLFLRARERMAGAGGRRIAGLRRGLTASPARSLLAALLAACGLAAHAEAPLGSSLDALLALARERNPTYAGMRHEADASSERIVSAGALPDAKLRTELRDITRMGEQNATLSPGRAGSTRYLLMQDIPWFGKRDLKREVAEFEAAGARGRAADTWSVIAAQIKTLHAQLYYLDRRERLGEENLDLLSRLERIAGARYAAGLAAQQDVVRAQVEQTALRNELLAVAAERRQAQARLNALLGRSPAAPLQPPERLRPLPAPAKLEHATLAERAQSRNPMLAAEESRLQAAEKSRELAYRNRYPDFTLGVAPIQYQSAVREWEVMLELNIPLQQGSRRAQEREAEAMLAAARARREAAATQVLRELAENVAALAAAGAGATLAGERLLPQAAITFQAALAGYENGRVDFATLLDAQRQIRQAKLSQLAAQVEEQSRLAEVERILGEEL